MKRFLRLPSPAMVVAGVALFVSLGGVSYGLATGSIDSREIQDGSIRNRDFKDGTLRGQEAKRNGFGGGAIKESTLDTVPSAEVGGGLAHHAVVGLNGALVRGRGVTSTSAPATASTRSSSTATCGRAPTWRRSATSRRTRLAEARPTSPRLRRTPTACAS